jgi:cytochrome P450
MCWIEPIQHAHDRGREGPTMPQRLAELDATPRPAQWKLLRDWIQGPDPQPFFEEARRRRPVIATPEATLAFRFADCTEILRRHDIFSVALYVPKQSVFWMAQDDTAQHFREKGMMSAILDREDLPKIRAWTRDKAKALLTAAGGKIDAVDGYTRLMPINLVQEWFGFTESDPKALQAWSYWNQLDAFWNQPFDSVVVKDQAEIVRQREAHNLEMRDYLTQLVQRRGAELAAGKPVNDPVARLLRLLKSGAIRIDPARLVLNVGGLLIGAVETTSHAVVNAVDWLLAHPDKLKQARALAAGPDDAAFDGVVFEALRFRPPFRYFFRKAERDALLARGSDFETRVAAGTTVIGVSFSALFDERGHERPMVFDSTRSRSNGFLFGQGLHECLGRAISEVMLPEMVRAALLLPDLKAAAIDRRGGPVPESWAWRWG